MEFVSSPPLKNLLIKDAEPGTGRTENALPAQITGSSTTWENVCLFPTNAIPSTGQEPVFHAMKDTTSTMEFAFLPLLRSLLMRDAEPGTGKPENALPVLTTGSSTMLESVCPSQISARPSIGQEPVSHVMKDTTLTTEFASSPLLRNHPTWDVELGTGRTENVWPVPTTGFSTMLEFVCPYQINAKLSTGQEPVFHATRDTTSTMESVNWLPLRPLLTPGVVFGTGTTRNA